jgi:dihydroorotase
MYDLILKGGTVLDPSQGLHGKMDVAITGDKISRVEPSIDMAEATRIVDLEGKIVTPGLIDIHTHLYHPGHNPSHPDTAGVRAGVTTVATAGDCIPSNFQEYCDFVLPRAQTRVYPFLRIHRDQPHQPTPKESEMDPDGVVKIAQENPDLVKGVKVLVSQGTVQALGLKHVEASKRAAREAGLRLLMHVGDIGPEGLPATPPKTIDRALSMLDPGDTVTHVFSPLPGAVLDLDGKVLPQLREAKERGVFLDTSYGDFHFSWRVADALLDQGVTPDTISTDIELQGGGGIRDIGGRGLLEYSAFFFLMGFSLEEVVRMMTVNSARALNVSDVAGSLLPGREADISVLDLLEGRWQLTDADGENRTGTNAFVPVLTIKSGVVIEPGEPPHTWGWTPPSEEMAPVTGDGQ